jgi:LPS sulfotransferase NodH
VARHVEQSSITYFICMVQRCGSNLLCEALSRTGVAGRPTEYFMPHFADADALGAVHAGFERSAWARERGISSFRDFLLAVSQEGQTENGVFGTKLPWNALEKFLRKLSELPDCSGLSGVDLLAAVFGKPRFIHLQRRDRVRQAVSWALAAQTGHWSSAEAAVRPPLGEPSFDIELLKGLYRLIGEGEAGWEAFFRRDQVEPLRLYHEDLVADLEGSVLEVLAWLGVPAPPSLDLSRLSHQPQGGRINEEWAERFWDPRPRIRREPVGWR